MASITRETVKIPSVEEGVTLDTWLYRPSAPAVTPYPVVIAAHGMTLVKEAGLSTFGQCWAEDAGYAALIFDYRGYGASDGEPRDVVNIKKQLQDYRSVIEWARGRPDIFRSDKLVVSATSFSGLHVADLVVHDSGLAGGFAQCPVLDGYASYAPLIAFRMESIRLAFWATIDAIRGNLGLSPLYIQAAGKPGESAYQTSPSVHPGFTALFSQSSTPFSQTRNILAPRIVFETLKCRPNLQLKDAKCPVLVVVAKDDDILRFSMTESIVKQTRGKVEMCIAPGGHFDIMLPGNPGYEVNIKAQIEFLRRLL